MSKSVVLITGADRGLGLEFVRQYAARGDSVIATCRNPDKASELRSLASGKPGIVIEKLDVTSDAEVDALAERYHGRPIDLLINNAGVLGTAAEQSLGALSRRHFHEVMDVNAFGPLGVSQALRANLIAGSGRKIVAVTSGLGSVAVAGGMAKGPYYYRMSKAALNMGMQALGADLKAEGVTVAVLSPGAADTAMFTAYREGYVADRSGQSPAAAVAGMIRVIDELEPVRAAQGILKYDGGLVPW